MGTSVHRGLICGYTCAGGAHVWAHMYIGAHMWVSMCIGGTYVGTRVHGGAHMWVHVCMGGSYIGTQVHVGGTHVCTREGHEKDTRVWGGDVNRGDHTRVGMGGHSRKGDIGAFWGGNATH